MSSEDFNVLAQRIDGVAWALMTLIAQLEIEGQLNSAALCNSLRNTADGHGRYPTLEHSAAVIREIADAIEDARSARQSLARPT